MGVNNDTCVTSMIIILNKFKVNMWIIDCDVSELLIKRMNIINDLLTLLQVNINI